MPLAPGEKLGPYEITALIGKGGMGEVYRASDPRLGRDVAIKVSKEQFSERFEREARAVAALNHPNVCTLFDVGPNYLVMEYVEGSAPKGPLPLDEALRIAHQIADALEAAHEKNITHRDLKPGNILLRPDGMVKVLDFGLAKVGRTSTSDAESATVTLGATQMGTILGTPAYMAPEQAKGKANIDKRADIWAFGVVLYELLTGQMMFQGGDLTEVLAAVVLKEPDLHAAPAQVRRLLKKCLEKDPQKRLRDIGDVWDYLESGAGSPAQPERLPHKRPWAWIAASLVATIAAVALGFFAYRHFTEETRVLRLFVPPPEHGSFSDVNTPAVSPDGRRIVFRADVDGKGALWVRDLDSVVPRVLAGTDDARFPFWSPDSRVIAFFAAGKLKRIDVAGGPALTVTDAVSGRGGSWNQDDVIVFAPTNSGPLSRVPAGGGTASPVTELDRSRGETSHRYPWFLPDGHHFLYTARSGDLEKTGILIGDLNDPKVHGSLLVASNTNAAYVPPGYLLFLRERTLMAQPFDAAKAKTTADAFPIAENVDYTSGNSQGQFSASLNGVLAYTAGGSGGSVQLSWLDRTGTSQGTLGKPGTFQWPSISPDGKTVAADRTDPQGGAIDIWLYDLTRGGADSRFTFGPALNQWPVWSADGSHIAFNSTRDGHGQVYQRGTGGTGQDEALDKPPGNARAEDWSHDGRYLIEERPNDPKTRNDIWVLSLTGDKKEAFKYVDSEFAESYAKLSPDGRFIAYTSDESKRLEIYVQTFPMKGGKWQVSTGGGSRPIWSRDGKELYFISADQKMMAASVIGGAQFASVPKALFDVRMTVDSWFDVSKDGRFLIPSLVEQTATVPLTVVINWQAGLKK